MTSPAAPVDSKRYVSMSYSQVMMLRFLHQTCLESHIQQVYEHKNPGFSMQEYIQSMAHTFDIFRDLDDVLRSGLAAMDAASSSVIDFIFSPLTFQYLLALAERQWTHEDFFYTDQVEAATACDAVNAQREDIILSLKANSLTPIPPLPAAIATA